ncbi:MAG: hypothetical protein ABIL09_10105, partial [Gemmatimonadota bacterium]
MDDSPDSSQVRPAEMAVARAWAALLTGTGPPSTPTSAAAPAPRHATATPFSFTCGARSSRDWLDLPALACDTGGWQGGRRLHRLRWRDPETSIVCTMELTEFADYPALEWVVRLCNEGSADSAPIAAFKALDVHWTCAREGETPELRRALGSDGRRDDFQYVCEELRQSMWDTARTVRLDSAANAAFRRARNGSPSFLMADSR